MSGNLHRRHMLKFMPADFKLIEYRQPPLKPLFGEDGRGLPDPAYQQAPHGPLKLISPPTNSSTCRATCGRTSSTA